MLADIAVTYLPTSYMGSDYARFHAVDDDKLLLIICDVTGHGVSAALMVNSLHAELDSLMKKGPDPGDLLMELDEIISAEFGNLNMYLTAFCGLLDYSSSRFKYSNYGHIPQYIFRTNDLSVERLHAQTCFVGLNGCDDRRREVYQNEVAFSRTDRILLFTDGVTEAMNPEREEFGPERLESFIKDNRKLAAEGFNERLLREIKTFSGDHIHDDIFILNISTK